MYGFIVPVKIAPQWKMQVTVAFPYNKSDKNGIQETEFNLPVGEIVHINHPTYQWYRNTKNRSKNKSESDIIDL